MLSFDEFNKGCCHSRKEFRARLQQFPAFNYAAHNWGYHALDEKEETTREIVLDSGSVFGGYDQPFTQNVTGLHVASFFGLVNAVNDLVIVSFEPDCKDSRGSTPLFYSARNGHLKVVEKLLAANADVNAATVATVGVWTALQAAAQGDHLEVVERPLAANANVDAAAAAAQGGHLEVVERLLAANADVNAAAAAAGGDHTTLQAAAQGGHLEVVERLLIANADVNAAAAADNDDSHTALQAAALGGHLEMVERLLAANAEVNAAAACFYGHTAPQAAALGGHLEVVERLLAANADVNPAAGGGHTALQAATQGGHLEVVRVLKMAGHGWLPRSKRKKTPSDNDRIASKKRF